MYSSCATSIVVLVTHFIPKNSNLNFSKPLSREFIQICPYPCKCKNAKCKTKIAANAKLRNQTFQIFSNQKQHQLPSAQPVEVDILSSP
jgi:hypothetical protein